jgi:hypothetical protein
MRASTTSWTNLLGSLGFKTKRKKRRAKPRPYRSRFAFRPQLAALEARQLMAGDFTIVDDGIEEPQAVGLVVVRDSGVGTATIDFATEDGTATAGSDYVATSGHSPSSPA